MFFGAMVRAVGPNDSRAHFEAFGLFRIVFRIGSFETEALNKGVTKADYPGWGAARQTRNIMCVIEISDAGITHRSRGD